MGFNIESGQGFDAELTRQLAMSDLYHKFQTLLIAKADAVNACAKYLQASRDARNIGEEDAKRIFNEYKDAINGS